MLGLSRDKSSNKGLKGENLIIVLILVGFLILVFLGLIKCVVSIPLPELETEESADNESDDAPGFEGYLFSTPHSLLKDIDSADKEEYIPGPETLNLSYFYDEDADTDDAINSFAGVAYQHLNSVTADLYASFYDLSDKTPLSMAQSLGLSSSRVRGNYNPDDPSHDPADQETWTVNSFSNVSVSFYDGDGHRIDGYYPAQEIMSLANVYMYFHDDYDPEHFREYCDRLFNEAVSYKISLGNVYYCSGCLNKTKAEESAEALALEAEELALANNISIESAYSLLNASLPEESSIEYIEDTGEAVYITDTETETEAEAETFSESLETEAETLAETTETEAPTLNETYETEQSSIEYIFDPVAYTSGFSLMSYTGQARKITAESIESIVDDQYESGSSVIYQDPYFRDGSSSAILDPADIPSGTASETESTAVYNPASSNTPKYYVNDEGIVMYDVIRPDYEGEIAEDEEAPADSDPAADTDASYEESIMARIQSLLNQANIQVSSDSYCPGHIDIYVSVTIKGIDDDNGLFKIDSAGNDEANYTERWQGWTDEMREYAGNLNNKDWFENYGLSISSISLSSALSEEEIANYLSALPADISDLRKDIISYALKSVGKVPYYWGGKPSGPGYEDNTFGILISPDTRGRILKGLDCSGWVNWVYWSVTGSSLAGQSTGTLVGCGRKIARSELRPGDIIIRVGGDAHVVMFLCWAEDGDFYAVHETGGVINNVTVSKLTANWPYYRSLLD